MVILAQEDLKVLFSRLVGNTKNIFQVELHLVANHEVEHSGLELRHESFVFRVKFVEVDQSISDDVELVTAFGLNNEALD